MNMSIYEGFVRWVGADKYSKTGGVRIKHSEAEDFLDVPGNLADIMQKGAKVKIKVETKGRKQVVTQAKLLEAPRAEESRGSGGQARPSHQPAQGVDWAAKDASIQYQSSRKDALQFLEILLANGALPLGSGKAPAKEQILADTLDRLTAGFFTDIASQGALKRATPQASEDPEVEEEDDDLDPPPPGLDFDDGADFEEDIDF
jgi:hypothetical protein